MKKKRFVLAIFIVIIFFPHFSESQTIYTKSDTINPAQDTVILKLDNYRGKVQWQYAKETTDRKDADIANTYSLEWINIDKANYDSLSISSDTTAYYRAMIFEDSCIPVFSDTVFVYSKKDSVIKIVFNDIINQDLIKTDLAGFKELLESSDTLYYLNKTSSFNPDSNKTTTTITIIPKSELTDTIIVIEYIPKEIAESANKIEFLTEPTTIINDDPLIMWHLKSTEGYRKIEIRYIFNGNAPTSSTTLVANGNHFNIENTIQPPILNPFSSETSGNNHKISFTVESNGSKINDVGIYYGLESNPQETGTFIKMGAGAGEHELTLNNLLFNTSYYLQVYIWDRTFGEIYFEHDFQTLGGSEDQNGLTDYRDNKTYKTVQIGDQIWVAENLAYLPKVSPPSVESYTEPYYYVYDYSGNSVYEAKATENYRNYGVLYNWTAAKTACPIGWHLPSDNEWKQMELAIGMSQDEVTKTGFRGQNEGNKLKTTFGWDYNGNGIDEFGFSGFPCGYRENMEFKYFGWFGMWWSYPETSSTNAWGRMLKFSETGIGRSSFGRKDGFSVRCVKD